MIKRGRGGDWLCTCARVSMILPKNCSATSAKFSASLSRERKSQNPKTQPDPNPGAAPLYCPSNWTGYPAPVTSAWEGVSFPFPSFTYTAAAAGESITRASFLHNIGTIGRPARGTGEERWKLVMVAAPRGRLALTIIYGRAGDEISER